MKVGSRVVCIDDMQKLAKAHWQTYRVEMLPVKGRPYTIRSIEDSPIGPCVRMEEIRNPEMQYQDGFGECRFHIKHFRELDEDFADRVLEKIIAECEGVLALKEIHNVQTGGW